MDRTRWQGIALFAFIPVVLFLYLRLPLGPGWSLALGFGLMIGHRFIAAPWAVAHAEERCFWCGRAGWFDGRVEVETRSRRWRLAVCRDEHGDNVARFLTFVEKNKPWIALGIFAPLLLLLMATLALALGHPFLSQDLVVLIFRTVVALTVVITSLAWLKTSSKFPLHCPFPLHNLFLLGISKILWIFRIVGLWWLALTLLALLSLR